MTTLTARENISEQGKILYNINSCGFRSPEFDNRENFITLGCSLTQGIGLPEENTWPHIVSRTIELHVWNLGVAGGASDTCYRLAKHYLTILKPKFVVMLEPERSRIELYRGAKTNLPYILRFASPDFDGYLDGQFIKTWITNEQNIDLHAEKNINAIAYFCARLNIDFYVMTDQDFLNLSKPLLDYKINYARDLMHPGKLDNEIIAQQIIEKIKNKQVYE
jgi:hypothetical protein